MLEHIKAKILFGKLLSRPDISKAYAMVGPEDSWYNTIKTVHESLAQIQTLDHEILEIKSHDGLALKAVYYPAENNADNITVICAHGYTSHAEREWAFPGLFYHSLGYHVLIPYQRAHGISEGKRITFGALEHLDMMAWVRKVNRMNPESRIVLHGLSMGGGIVLYLSDQPMDHVKCLIADAPTPGIASFFENVSGQVFKSDGEAVARCALADFRKQTGMDASDFNVVERIKNGKYPVLLSAGSEEHLEELFQQIEQNNPCDTDIILLPGCNHGNGMYKQTEMYQQKIKEFIHKNV